MTRIVTRSGPAIIRPRARSHNTVQPSGLAALWGGHQPGGMTVLYDTDFNGMPLTFPPDGFNDADEPFMPPIGIYEFTDGGGSLVTDESAPFTSSVYRTDMAEGSLGGGGGPGDVRTRVLDNNPPNFWIEIYTCQACKFAATPGYVYSIHANAGTEKFEVVLLHTATQGITGGSGLVGSVKIGLEFAAAGNGNYDDPGDPDGPTFGFRGQHAHPGVGGDFTILSHNGPALVTKDAWTIVETHFKASTVGEGADGFIRIWLNGVLAMDQALDTTSQYGGQTYAYAQWMEGYRGGGDSERYEDGFLVQYPVPPGGQSRQFNRRSLWYKEAA